MKPRVSNFRTNGSRKINLKWRFFMKIYILVRGGIGKFHIESLLSDFKFRDLNVGSVVYVLLKLN